MTRHALLTTFLLSFCLLSGLAAQDRPFKRGDANGDGTMDISDPVFTLVSMFVGSGDLRCRDAADVDDDGKVNITDAIYSLGYLFLGGSAPKAPGLSCGIDPTADNLDCIAYGPCAGGPVFEGQSEFETPLGDGGLLDGDVARGGAVPGGAPPPAAEGNKDAATTSAERLIEESDIYRIVGDTMVVLNRYRGLQVIDIADLSAPVLLGQAPIFGQPKEMYVRNGRAFVFVSDFFRFQPTALVSEPVSGFYGSQLQVFDLTDLSDPQLMTAFDFEGFYEDSRIVGDVLYFVVRRQTYYYSRYLSDNQNKTEIVSVSVEDPSRIEIIDQQEFPRDGGWEHHIYVTRDAVFLAEPFYERTIRSYRTSLRYIDISDPAGSIVVRGRIDAPGRIQDRWSMDEFEGVLRVASGQSWGNGDVYLTTFGVMNPDRLSRLGQYTLHVEERLTAARFDRDRGYLVSYRNIDPLFTFDLADPANPVLTGELEMTGWLDFMVPLDDRIVALGHDDLTDANGRRQIKLAVSLIDATRGSPPKLLSRVGLEGIWGNVPAERDDFAKVFRVLPEKDLVVFPFRAWNPETYRMLSAVQLIDVDLEADTLTRRGLVDDAGLVERGIPHGENDLMTLSNEIFQTLDISDRDNPSLRGRLELARNVQNFAVLPGGEYAVQLSGEWYLGDVKLTVTPLADPNTPSPVASVAVPGPYGRMFVNGSMVYVTSVKETVTGKRQGVPIRQQQTHIQVIDLSDPENPVERGSMTLPEPVWGSYGYWSWGYGDEVVQVNGSTLAFHRNVYSFWFVDVDVVGGVRAPEIPERQIFIADLADPDNPKLASTVTLSEVNWAWGLKAFGTKIYLSTYISHRDDQGHWMARYFLHRIDVADPAEPVAHPPVNIPGMFVGASTDGELIYTHENRWDWTTRESQSFFYALALKDDQAFLQSRVELPGGVNGVLVRGSAAFAMTRQYIRILLDAGGFTWNQKAELIAIDLGDPGNLTLASRTEIPFDYVWLREVAGGHAFLGSGQGIFLYDVSNITLPVFKKFHRTRGYPQEIVLEAEKAYLPSGVYGVQVLDLSGNGAP